MYPFIRLAKEFALHRTGGGLPALGVHISRHQCWPQDIDIFLDMKNGTILTILDLGRTILARGIGSDYAAQALYRAAVTDAQGIVVPDAVFAKVGHDAARPDLLPRVTQWIGGDRHSPWPPDIPAP